MSATPIPITSTGPAADNRRLLTPEFLCRCALVAIAVLICYRFEWHWLRTLTCDLNLRLDALAGVHLQRLSAESVMWQGSIFNYEVSCTFADVWCGAMPLLWNVRRSVTHNLGLIVATGIALLVFNVVRLTFSDVLFARGLSWDIAHNVVSGIAYFIIWTALERTRPWQWNRITATVQA